MIKLKTTQYYLSDRFENHSEIKSYLLDLIDECMCVGFENEDEHYKHRITRYDWTEHKNWERPWVEFLLPYIVPKLNSIVNELGFSNINLEALWFQQYELSSIHDWHIHGSNYTGVYYLELPHDVPKTAIYDGEQIITPKVEEGDLCIFPAMAPHISMKNESLSRKTIISYNFNMAELDIDTLKNMKKINYL